MIIGFTKIAINRTIMLNEIFVKSEKSKKYAISRKKKGVVKESVHSVEITGTQCGKMKNLASPKKYFVKSTL